jgi:signal transduction histidine kinase
MTSVQSAAERSSKSIGKGATGKVSDRLDSASQVHGVGRVGSGFNLAEVVAEYRALRASVIRLWRDSCPNPHLTDLDDLTRFNESIDQSLTAAVVSYTKRIDQSRQMFLAILAHDLRNPLNSIMMSAAVVSMTGKCDPESTEAASQITASAAAIARMVTDLLDFAGNGIGAAMPLSPSPMDLVLLCQEVCEEFRSAHPACPLKFEAHGDLTGTWDASRLRQVLSNLLGNAAQHGSASCEVRLSATTEGEDILLAVHNNGAPIPAEVLPTLFEPLVRHAARNDQKPRRPGSIGLGLYIARQIAESHGGGITVTSTLDAGTSFTVRLPRHHLTAAGQPILDEKHVQTM